MKEKTKGYIYALYKVIERDSNGAILQEEYVHDEDKRSDLINWYIRNYVGKRSESESLEDKRTCYAKNSSKFNALNHRYQIYKISLDDEAYE